MGAGTFVVVQRGQVTLHQQTKRGTRSHDRVPRFFMSRVDVRGERLLLRALVALAAANEVCHTNAQHRTTSDPGEGYAVEAGEREAGALLVGNSELYLTVSTGRLNKTRIGSRSKSAAGFDNSRIICRK